MTVSSVPAYPVVGDSVAVSSDANDTGARAAHVVLELTSVPSASALSLGFQQESTDDTATTAAGVASRGIAVQSFAPDAAGDYGVVVHLYHEKPPLPSVHGPDALTTYVLKSTDSGTIKVGAELDLPIFTTGGDGGVLRIEVVDTTVRAASIVSTANEKSRQAALQSTVTAAVAALVGVAVGTIGNGLQAGVNNLRAQYEAHRVIVGGGTPVHSAADNTNKVIWSAADSDAGAIALLNRIREQMLKHLLDSSSAGTAWHTNDDRKNLPATNTATDVASATVVLADLRERVYERHRVQTASPAVHGSADSTNTLTANTKLDDVIVAFLDALVDDNPTAPAGEPEGVTDAMHLYGFGPSS